MKRLQRLGAGYRLPSGLCGFNRISSGLSCRPAGPCSRAETPRQTRKYRTTCMLSRLGELKRIYLCVCVCFGETILSSSEAA